MRPWSVSARLPVMSCGGTLPQIVAVSACALLGVGHSALVDAGTVRVRPKGAVKLRPPFQRSGQSGVAFRYVTNRLNFQPIDALT